MNSKISLTIIFCFLLLQTTAQKSSFTWWNPMKCEFSVIEGKAWQNEKSGFGGDRIENVFWRMQNGELDGFVAKQVMVMVGTNNLQSNPDKEIVQGIENLINAIKVRQPRTS